MPLWQCEHADCLKPAERDIGCCKICSAHICSKHADSEYHSCPTEIDDNDAFWIAYDSAQKDHLETFLASINFGKLAAIASSLRDGIRCTLPAMHHDNETEKAIINTEMVMDQMGGTNCHVDCHFEDGVVWMARLRLEKPRAPPLETRQMISASEVGTLRFLDRAGLPVPKVFYHTLDPSGIGTPFMFMEKMPGRPLQWNEASAEEKTKVMKQLVDVYLELEKHPLPAAGSLTEGGAQVGPIAQWKLFSTPSKSLAPFDKLEDSLKAILEQQIELLKSGELATRPIDTYLTHLWRLEQIPALAAANTDMSFYIKHDEDKGDHILVDEQFNVTGLIDWEFASTQSKDFAFTSPCMMWPVCEFYDGSNKLSAEEVEFADMFQQRGRDDMAQIVLQGRKYQRFLFFLGDEGADQTEFETLFQGLREAFEGPSIGSYSEWRSAAMPRAVEANDPILAGLMLAEKQD